MHIHNLARIPVRIKALLEKEQLEYCYVKHLSSNRNNSNTGIIEVKFIQNNSITV